jgi:hypothetical protein
MARHCRYFGHSMPLETPPPAGCYLMSSDMFTNPCPCIVNGRGWSTEWCEHYRECDNEDCIAREAAYLAEKEAQS